MLSRCSTTSALDHIAGWPTDSWAAGIPATEPSPTFPLQTASEAKAINIASSLLLALMQRLRTPYAETWSGDFDALLEAEGGGLPPDAQGEPIVV